MLSLAYTKTLLLVALCLAPQGTHSIMATSNTRTYVWSQDGDNWSLKCKGYPSTDWNSVGTVPTPASDSDSRMLREHNWHRDSAAFLENGNRVEQKHGAAFYIVDPGQANENVFTILYRK
jgi:hypothetical protein